MANGCGNSVVGNGKRSERKRETERRKEGETAR